MQLETAASRAPPQRAEESAYEPLQDVEPAVAVDQEDQSPVVHEHVVRERMVEARRRVRHEARDLLRRARAADVDDAHAVA